jgi:hypothetical protein
MSDLYQQTPAEEVKRIEDLEYPDAVSQSILDNLEFTSMVDAGCGPSDAMARYAASRGASYNGFDNGRVVENGAEVSMALVLQRKIFARGFNGSVYIGDITKIPTGISNADLVHERFVLMHVDRDQWHTAVSEMLKIANKQLVFAEWDWKTLDSRRHAMMIQKFKKAAWEMMMLLKIDPLAGTHMWRDIPQYVPADAKVTKWENHREEGDYTKEFAAKCSSLIVMANRLGRSDLEDVFVEMVEELSYRVVNFTPPMICGITVEL